MIFIKNTLISISIGNSQGRIFIKRDKATKGKRDEN